MYENNRREDGHAAGQSFVQHVFDKLTRNSFFIGAESQ